MAKSLQLKYAIWAYLSLTWSAMAYAAENPFVAGIDSIPHKAVAYVFGLAMIGGAAGTLSKLAKPETVVRNLPLEICKDILASIVAGLLAFFLTSGLDSVAWWATAAAVTITGYGGSKVLDFALVEGVMPWLKNFMHRVFNTTPPKDGTP